MTIKIKSVQSVTQPKIRRLVVKEYYFCTSEPGKYKGYRLVDEAFTKVNDLLFVAVSSEETFLSLNRQRAEERRKEMTINTQIFVLPMLLIYEKFCEGDIPDNGVQEEK